MEGYGNENPGAFQPTRPLRGATRRAVGLDVVVPISTHAPLAGRDALDGRVALHEGISTHAPLAGRDRTESGSPAAERNFNPRAPCGARRSHQQGKRDRKSISTHAPLAGRDVATGWRAGSRHKISTHAPLAGRDSMPWSIRLKTCDFNPRAPCGARRVRARWRDLR